jgi:hypothetical protein
MAANDKTTIINSFFIKTPIARNHSWSCHEREVKRQVIVWQATVGRFLWFLMFTLSTGEGSLLSEFFKLFKKLSKPVIG